MESTFLENKKTLSYVNPQVALHCSWSKAAREPV